MSAAIVANGLTKRFESRDAVVDVSFQVARGEVFGFLGPNGAGKTTTVRMLTSLLPPTAGAAEVAGIPVGADTGPDLRSRIGVMTETPGLYLKLTLEENLRYFAGLYDLADADSRIGDALESVGLAERRHDRAGTLSKGLRQRAALARALLPEPEILFLDEPTTGLDPEASVQVRSMIEGLRKRGMTVFLTTHRLDEAERLCDRVAIIKTRLVTVAPTDQLRRVERPAVSVRLATPLLDPAGLFGSLPGVSGWSGQQVADGGGEPVSYRVEVTTPSEVVPDLVRALVGAGASVLAVTEVTRTLEEAYLELVREEP